MFMKIIYMSLIDIYESISNLSPSVIKDFFGLKNTPYDLRSKQLLKLPETRTSRYGTETLF